jgi:hypothetical protein
VKKLRPRKWTKKELEKQLQASVESVERLRQENDVLYRRAKALELQLSQKVDDRMIAARTQLCNGLGQMLEATSRAVMYIVGKEAL